MGITFVCYNLAEIKYEALAEAKLILKSKWYLYSLTFSFLLAFLALECDRLLSSGYQLCARTQVSGCFILHAIACKPLGSNQRLYALHTVNITLFVAGTRSKVPEENIPAHARMVPSGKTGEAPLSGLGATWDGNEAGTGRAAPTRAKHRTQPFILNTIYYCISTGILYDIHIVRDHSILLVLYPITAVRLL